MSIAVDVIDKRIDSLRRLATEAPILKPTIDGEIELLRHLRETVIDSEECGWALIEPRRE